MSLVRTVRSLSEINRKQWDSIAGDNAFATYGWLKTIEETSLGPGVPQYALLETNGRLAGAAVCQLMDSPGNGSSLDNRLFGRAGKAIALTGFSFYPAILCGPTWSIDRHFLVEPSADEATRADREQALLEWVENEAAERGYSAAFFQLTENDRRLAERLRRRHFGSTVWDPINYLDIEWSTFNEYREHIRKISRNMEANIRKEVNRNRREGVEIVELEKIGAYEKRMKALVDGNHFKYNGSPFPFSSVFFSRLKENMGSDAVVYAAFKEGMLTGVSVLLRRNSHYYVPIVGVDHELSGNDATYFNLSIYRPLMDAIARGIKRIYLGVAMYELKEKRGFKVMNSHSYYKSYNRIKNMAAKSWFVIRSEWWRRKYSKYIDRAAMSETNRARRTNTGRP